MFVLDVSNSISDTVSISMVLLESEVEVVLSTK